MTLSASTSSVAARANISRAWLWIRTNPDRTYRRYFRSIYRSFALCAPEALENIRRQLLADSYRASRAVKLFFPKASGVLRPYSLLTVEDQIVYQALANVIAERLHKRVGARYNRTIFGNLYAGQSSLYFFAEWRRSYAHYTASMRRAFAMGYRFAASFDLTACYDAIDHSVLRYFLRDLRFDEEFGEQLCDCLSAWTETANRRKPLYHGHGIPQGPQASGIIAECVLRHFDDAKRPIGVRYFRYVDDIRLFATDEEALRRELVKLDVRSKEIGLFPQGSKIHIHKVTDIEDELKSISNPPELSVAGSDPDQRHVRKRLVELSSHCRVSNSTRFKYVLGSASPNATLALRLLQILRNEPHYYEAVCRHFEKYHRFSKKVSAEALALLREAELYSAFTSSLIRILREAIHPAHRSALQRYCRSRLSGQKLTRDPELRAMAASVLMRDNAATWAQTQFNLFWRHHWWVRAELIGHIPAALIGPPSTEHLLNRLLRDESSNVAVVAAEALLTNRAGLSRPYHDVNEAAQWALRRAGVIGQTRIASCPINAILVSVLGVQLRPVRLRRILPAKTYWLLTRRFAVWEAYAATDATAWVALSDTINDILLDALFRHDASIGGYSLGNIGSVIHSSGSAFAQRYPRMRAAALKFHELRLEADIIHPRTRSTHRPTRRIRFRELPRLRRELAAGFLEYWQKW